MTTEQRAERAYRILLNYQHQANIAHDQVDWAITSLLIDIMHLQSQYAFTYDELSEKAKAHFSNDTQTFEVAGVYFEGNEDEVKKEFSYYTQDKPFDFDEYVSFVNDTQRML